MKKSIALCCVLLVSFLISCTQKTNKDSRQFESLIVTKALSKDTIEFNIITRNYYVFESTAEDLFNEKGYFINETPESQSIVEAIVRSNIRTVIGNYTEKQLTSIKSSVVKNKILNLNNSLKFETGTPLNFKVKFNAIFIEKLEQNDIPYGR